MSDDYGCCASGSCEVCRRPQGYTREQRDEIARVMDTYDPPWVLERKREDARRGLVNGPHNFRPGGV